jgi:hypothetical protein
MNFHLNFQPPVFQQQVNLQHKLFLLGSCFTEQVGNYLNQHYFQTLQNPHGILFNPLSMALALESYMERKQYAPADLFYDQELWGSWQHHTRFSSPEATETLAMINTEINAAHDFLKSADWLLLTIGSAFVYRLKDGNLVANCHKVPADKFSKTMLSPSEIVAAYTALLEKLRVFNPNLKLIFTISPVRHLRDGLIENNRSKAVLIQAIHELVNATSHASYFPSYELVIDDLRDYRFYAEDMVHPNYAATRYVWEKFSEAAIDPQSQVLMKELNQLRNARQHKAFNPKSIAHQRFVQTHLQLAEQLLAKYPYLPLQDDILYFKSALV